MELNVELRSSTNGNTVAVAKITGERGWTEGEKKCLCVVLLSGADQKFTTDTTEFGVERNAFRASYSTSNKLLLVVRHIMTTGLQKCL